MLGTASPPEICGAYPTHVPAYAMVDVQRNQLLAGPSPMCRTFFYLFRADRYCGQEIRSESNTMKTHRTR